MTPDDPAKPAPARSASASWMLFLCGIAVGSALIGLAVPLAIYLMFAVDEHPGGQQGYTALLPFVVIAVLCVVLSVLKETRKFGLGLLAGVPLGFLAVYATCGGKQ